MKKRILLPLIFLLTFTLWLTPTPAAEEWTPHKTLNFGGDVWSVAFGPPGTNQLAIGTDYNSSTFNLEIYDISNFNAVKKEDFKVDNDEDVRAVAFRNGWYEVAVAYQDRLAFYNSKQDVVIEDEGNITNGRIEDLDYSPDGKRLAIGTANHTILIWHTDHQNGNRRKLRTLRGHTGWVRAVAFSPHGNILASGSDDGTVRLWNPNTGVNYAVLRGHQNEVRDVAFSPNGQMLASGSIGSPYVILWNVNTENKIRTINTGNADSVAWSPDGNTLAVGQWYTNGNVKLYNPSTGSFRQNLFVNSPVLSLDFHFNGRLLAAAGGTGKFVKIFKLIPVNANDVTKDGRVDINDLVAVARDYGKTGSRATDVNNDNRVDIKDLTAVAKAINPAFAAPTLVQEITALPFTVKEVQQWIQDAKKQGVDAEGITVLEQLLAALTHVKQTPKETALLANYPNPFNPETWIPYQLAKPAEVTVSIHSADGILVRTLALGQLPAGVYQDKDRAAYWDGTNEQGESVASGVYFYTLKAGDFSATKKMLIRK